MTMMTQCRLIRSDGATQDAWIDAKLGIVGRNVDLKIDGAWDRGWRVDRAGGLVDAKYVAERARDFKHHRIATDI